ncbi:hypothetical protein BH11PLA2_BH11PLA2_48260 [soil metagenome]
MARFVSRKFAKLNFEPLEDRTTPTIIVQINGTAVTFTGDSGADNLQLYTNGAGQLTHNLPIGGNLVSSQDLDSTTAGEQAALTANLTNITVNLGAGGGNVLTADNIFRPVTLSNIDYVTGSLAVATNAVLTNTAVAFTNPTATWTLSNIGNIRLDAGTGDNTLDASAVTNYPVYFRGNDGNDTLRGGSQPDFLVGGIGNDILDGNGGDDSNSSYNPNWGYGGIYGEEGNDTLRGGPGNDFIQDIGPDGAADGGTGTDYYYAYSAASALITDTTFKMGAATSIGNSFENIRIDGDNNDNVLDASAVTAIPVYLRGNDGNDTLRGGAQPDFLVGGIGNDTIDGNGGDDSNSVYNPNWGYGGLYGEEGNDTIRGGPGNDFIQDIGPDGAADGGTGTDYYYAYSAASALITDTTFSMGTAASIGNGMEAIRIDGDDNANVLDASAVTAIPVFFRGNGGDDTLRGGSQPDFLVGGIGNDILEGNGGDDSNSVYNPNWGYGGLYGEEGNDTIRGGPGNDFLQDIGPAGSADGGPGTDYYYIYNAASALITDTTLSVGGAMSVGNGMEAIRIDGDDNANVLDASAVTAFPVNFRGNGGDDTLRGGSQPDFLVGGIGNDTIDGNGGDDSNSVYNPNWGYGGIYGEEGNDILRGGPGNDFLQDIGPDGAADGGTGTDYLFIYNVSAAVITDTSLAFGTATSVGNGLEGIRVDGTPGNDTFTATGFTLCSVWLRGGDGNDVLRGGEQHDNLEGGNGDDMLLGNGGDDTNTYLPSINTNGGLYGGDGNDTISGGSGDDYIDGGSGNDDLTGGTGNDLIYGGVGDDILRDGPETNTLVGDAGTDSIRLTATSGADLILVADGSVTINGAVTAYTLSESLIIDAGAGVDEGTQVGATHPLAYVVNNLEPTVFGGPDVTTTAVPFIRTGTFKDIGAGQNTWTGQADFGEGAGFEPITVDSFNKSFSLNHSYSAGGSFLVRIRITDQQGNIGESSFTVFRPAGVQVGVGGVQRSMIPKLTVSFDGLYTINPGYFTFQRLFNGTSPSVNAVISTLNNKTVITMTFSGAIEANTNSLLDGDYRLTLDSTKILTNPGGQQFDGNGDGSPGGAFVFNFHRLLGDGNGDRTVNGADLVQFGNVFSSNAPEFDFNIDGTVNGADLVVFGNHFGTTI